MKSSKAGKRPIKVPTTTVSEQAPTTKMSSSNTSLCTSDEELLNSKRRYLSDKNVGLLWDIYKSTDNIVKLAQETPKSSSTGEELRKRKANVVSSLSDSSLSTADESIRNRKGGHLSNRNMSTLRDKRTRSFQRIGEVPTCSQRQKIQVEQQQHQAEREMSTSHQKQNIVLKDRSVQTLREESSDQTVWEDRPISTKQETPMLGQDSDDNVELVLAALPQIYQTWLKQRPLLDICTDDAHIISSDEDVKKEDDSVNSVTQQTHDVNSDTWLALRNLETACNDETTKKQNPVEMLASSHQRQELMAQNGLANSSNDKKPEELDELINNMQGVINYLDEATKEQDDETTATEQPRKSIMEHMRIVNVGKNEAHGLEGVYSAVKKLTNEVPALIQQQQIKNCLEQRSLKAACEDNATKTKRGIKKEKGQKAKRDQDKRLKTDKGTKGKRNKDSDNKVAKPPRPLPEPPIEHPTKTNGGKKRQNKSIDIAVKGTKKPGADGLGVDSEKILKDPVFRDLYENRSLRDDILADPLLRELYEKRSISYTNAVINDSDLEMDKQTRGVGTRSKGTKKLKTSGRRALRLVLHGLDGHPSVSKYTETLHIDMSGIQDTDENAIIEDNFAISPSYTGIRTYFNPQLPRRRYLTRRKRAWHRTQALWNDMMNAVSKLMSRRRNTERVNHVTLSSGIPTTTQTDGVDNFENSVCTYMPDPLDKGPPEVIDSETCEEWHEQHQPSDRLEQCCSDNLLKNRLKNMDEGGQTEFYVTDGERQVRERQVLGLDDVPFDTWRQSMSEHAHDVVSYNSTEERMSLSATPYPVMNPDSDMEPKYDQINPNPFTKDVYYPENDSTEPKCDIIVGRNTNNKGVSDQVEENGFPVTHFKTHANNVAHTATVIKLDVTTHQSTNK